MWYKAYNMLYDDEYVLGSHHGAIFDTKLTDKDLMVKMLEDWCKNYCNGSYSVMYNEKDKEYKGVTFRFMKDNDHKKFIQEWDKLSQAAEAGYYPV